MKAFLGSIALAAILTITGCKVGNGDSAPAPSNLKVSAGDTSAVVTWDQESGVEYWVWVAQGSDVSTSNCAHTPACKIYTRVSPPFVIAGLANGTIYSVTVNARRDDGPGGPGTEPIAFVPRIAGGTWTPGPSLGQVNLLGLAFTSQTATTGVTTAVTVGTNGASFFSNDSVTWTATTSNVTTNLNGAAYATSRFIAVGDAGVLLASADGITWATQASSTSANLRAVVSNGGATYVAVGDHGTIVVSSDGTTWAAANSQTAADLYGVTFANGLFVAVGANGVIVTSPDGGAWTPSAVVTSASLRGVSYGAYVATATAVTTATWVTVGDNGTLLTSADGLAWTPQLPIAATNFASITHGTQFIAVGDGGTIYTSVDGIGWQPAVSGVTDNLHAIVFTVLTGGSVGVGYITVGDHGANLTSF